MPVSPLDMPSPEFGEKEARQAVESFVEDYNFVRHMLHYEGSDWAPEWQHYGLQSKESLVERTKKLVASGYVLTAEDEYQLGRVKDSIHHDHMDALKYR